MIKWIIELLKRIFMQPETTDRLTEDTNVDEKRVLTKEQLQGVETSGAYWLSFEVQEYVEYQKAEDNNYCLEGYVSQNTAGTLTPYADIYPLNIMILRLDTGLMTIESQATQNSLINPEGNRLNIAYRMNYQAAAGVFDVYFNRVLYATKVTDDRIW